MTSASAVPAPRSAAERVRGATGAPALRSGDRLARSEFERRYALRPDLEKAELIEGIVRMPSPVSLAHSGPHAMIQGVLLVYSAFTPGVRCEDNATVRLDPDNEPQPDVLLRIEPDAGGQSRVSGDDYVEGAPELVVEIAASSASIDLHDKLRAYRRNGVREYVVWPTQERRIDWFELVDGDYRPRPGYAACLHVTRPARCGAGRLRRGPGRGRGSCPPSARRAGRPGPARRRGCAAGDPPAAIPAAAPAPAG